MTAPSERLLTFIETRVFTESWEALGLSDEDLVLLQKTIAARPTGFPVISGTGGLRKLRFARLRSATGKRGGLRICYAAFVEHGLVLLVLAYAKSEQDNLSPTDKKTVRQLLQRQQDALVEKPIQWRKTGRGES